MWADDAADDAADVALGKSDHLAIFEIRPSLLHGEGRISFPTMITHPV